MQSYRWPPLFTSYSSSGASAPAPLTTTNNNTTPFHPPPSLTTASPCSPTPQVPHWFWRLSRRRPLRDHYEPTARSLLLYGHRHAAGVSHAVLLMQRGHITPLLSPSYLTVSSPFSCAYTHIQAVSFMVTISIFLLLCIGADDIFVFTDCWKVTTLEHTKTTHQSQTPCSHTPSFLL